MTQDSDVFRKLLESLPDEELAKLGATELTPDARALFYAELNYRNNPSALRPKDDVVYVSGLRQKPFAPMLIPLRAWNGTESLWRVFWLMVVPLWILADQIPAALFSGKERRLAWGLLLWSMIMCALFAPLMKMIWRCRNNLTERVSWAKTLALVFMGYLGYGIVVGVLAAAGILLL